MKKILVTGANGFIGGRLAERLAEEGAHVRGLVRSVRARHSANAGDATNRGDLWKFDGFSNETVTNAAPLQIVHGDITDADAIRRAVADCNIVIHCAAKQFPPGSRAQFIAENVGGFENLARAALEFGVERFVHISTINVHGFPPPPDCNAESPLCESGDFYSDSKVATERAAWQFYREKNLPLVVVRPAITYGPRGGAWTLTPIKRLRAGKRVLIGDGRGICNAVHIDNLIDLILLAAQNDAAIGQAFIGAEGRGVTWREFYGAYAQMLGITRMNSVPLFAARAIAYASEIVARVTGQRPFVARQSVEFYSHRVVYDIEKSKRLLGYAPRVSFAEGMRLTQKWLVDSGTVRQ